MITCFFFKVPFFPFFKYCGIWFIHGSYEKHLFFVQASKFLKMINTYSIKVKSIISAKKKKIVVDSEISVLWNILETFCYLEKQSL